MHNLSIRAKGKLLLENTTLTVAAGRRYGLVGPNGKGKSTLLRMIARRQVPVPDTLDVLLVEQEIVGTEKSALEAVVAADVELMELREEEADINRCGALAVPARKHAGSWRCGDVWTLFAGLEFEPADQSFLPRFAAAGGLDPWNWEASRPLGSSRALPPLLLAPVLATRTTLTWRRGSPRFTIAWRSWGGPAPRAAPPRSCTAWASRKPCRWEPAS